MVFFLLVLVVCLILLAPLRLEVEILNVRARAKLRWLGLGFGVDSRGATYQLSIGKWIFHRGSFGSEKKSPAKKEKTKKESSRFSWRGLLDSRGDFSSVLGYLKRHLHTENLELDLVIATPDPALTGELLGIALGLRSALGQFVDLTRLRVGADFLNEWPQIYFALKLKTRLVHLLFVAVRVWLAVRPSMLPKKAQVKRLVRTPA